MVFNWVGVRGLWGSMFCVVCGVVCSAWFVGQYVLRGLWDSTFCVVCGIVRSAWFVG